MSKTYKQLVDETLKSLIGEKSEIDIITLIHDLYGVPQFHNMDSSEALYEIYPVFVENMEGFEDWRVDNEIYGTNKYPQPGDIMYIKVDDKFDSVIYVFDVDKVNDRVTGVMYNYYQETYVSHEGPVVSEKYKTLAIITPPKNRIVPEITHIDEVEKEDENEIVLIHPKTFTQIREAIHKMKLNVTDTDFTNCIVSTLVPEGEILETSRAKLKILYEEMDKRIHKRFSIEPMSEDEPDVGTVVNLDSLFD